MLEGDVIGAHRRGAGGDQDEPGLQLDDRSVQRLDRDRVAVGDASVAAVDVDAEAVEVAIDPVVLLVLDAVALGHELVDREMVVHLAGDPGQGPPAQRRAELGRLAQRPGGDRPRVDHRPAGAEVALDDRHPAAEGRRLRGGRLAGGSAADADQVVGLHEGRYRPDP